MREIPQTHSADGYFFPYSYGKVFVLHILKELNYLSCI